ncbi:hypothetical protein ANANG_G00049930 [Anguilla anguilla]|uniref:Uncharacterized protein n=1 Tax=Anguilla anguilla TaxID=7936 RepID=A0A9D3S5I7_ANGAN|nr:hypothetical protein ANANG_G00049930 [Anguilla anguilla]
MDPPFPARRPHSLDHLIRFICLIYSALVNLPVLVPITRYRHAHRAVLELPVLDPAAGLALRRRYAWGITLLPSNEDGALGLGGESFVHRHKGTLDIDTLATHPTAGKRDDIGPEPGRPSGQR